MRLAGTKLAANHQYRGFGDQLYDLSGQRPSLDLNFANSKSLVDATTGQNLVTFTRASSGTYVDSQGVIRTATTNLLLQSEDFSTTWTNGNSTETVNAFIAPNGTLTADLFSADASTTLSARNLLQDVSGNVSIPHTFSVYARAKDANFLNLTLRNQAATSNLCRVEFNLSTGTISVAAANGGNATGASASISPVGNDWYRCSISGTADTVGTQFTLLINGRTTSGSNTVTANTQLLYLWGAQLDQSSTVGEYIPTTSTINSAPRFDHNPTTGESLGLLVEEARTNLSQQSENFSDVYWAKTDCTITSNESTAPDGTLTADLWTNTATPGVVQNNLTKDATARTYTGSLWVKSNVTAFTLSIDAGTTANRGRVVFNLSNGTLTSTVNDGAFTNTSGTITAYADNWYRLTVTTTTSTGTSIRLRAFFSNVGATARIWGAQVEEGAFPTSYIPTTTATVTRSADVASITGSNFSSWYRQDEGTVYGDFSNYGLTGKIFSLNVNSTTDRIFIGRGSASGGNINAVVSAGGVAQVPTLLLGTSLPTFTSIKTAFGYKTSDFAGTVNGLTPATQSTGSLPTVTQATLGNGEAIGTNQINGTIRRLTYFPTRLANETLQRITQ